MWNGSVYGGLQFEEEGKSAYHVGTYACSQSYFQGAVPCNLYSGKYLADYKQ